MPDAPACPAPLPATPQATAAPCSTCPWRTSSTVGGADIPRFDLDLMRGLRNTVGFGDEIRPIMACHGSACGDERPCVGYVHVEGYSNLAVRIAAIEGRVDFRAIDEACSTLDLWPSFGEMLTAYEAVNDGDAISAEAGR